MKYAFILLLSVAFFCSATAQTIYESPYVKDGETIQFTIPEGFFEVNQDFGSAMHVYTSKEIDNIDISDFESLDIGAVIISHTRKVGETLKSKQDEIERRVLGEDGVRVIRAPEISRVNGMDWLYAGFEGDRIGKNRSAVYFSAVEFGDFFILVSYFSPVSSNGYLDFNEFQAIIKSAKKVKTDKEDELEQIMEEEYNSYAEDLDDYSLYFQNDLFETSLSYYDILPDAVMEWDDYIDDKSLHLLAMFSYKDEGGYLRIFSGGSTTNYPTNEERARAIEQVTEWKQPITLTYDSQFSNEDHFFKLFSIEGGGTMTSVYTTIVNRELIFFVVDGGENPDEDFKPAVRDFMLTMWVDYYEGDD